MGVAADAHRAGRDESIGRRIVDLRRCITVSPRNQHPPVIEQRRRMARAGLRHLRAHSELSGLRVIEFGRLKRPAARVRTAPRDQHAPVLQQRRRMVNAIGAHRPGRREFSAGRIVNLRPRLATAHHQHAPTRQHRRGLPVSALRHVAGRGKLVHGAVEEFRAVAAAPGNHYLATGQQRGARLVARRRHRRCGAEIAVRRIKNLARRQY